MSEDKIVLDEKIIEAYKNAVKRAYLKSAMVYPVEEDNPLDAKRLKEQFDFQLRLQNKYMNKVARKFNLSKKQINDITAKSLG